jgi:hypothetical protein
MSKQVWGILVVIPTLVAPPALAGSVRFGVGPVKGVIVAHDFDLVGAQAYLECRFEDGSGAVRSRPSATLATDRVRLRTFSPPAYRLEIAAGRLDARKLFAELRSCAYRLRLTAEWPGGRPLTDDLTLAGSVFNMSEEALRNLLSDPALGERISARIERLELTVDRTSRIFRQVK